MTLEQLILRVLELYSGKCLDNEAERQQAAEDLFDMLDWYFDDDRGV